MRLLMAFAVYFLSQISHAAPVAYEFTTTWVSGDLSGTASKGYFAFDSSRIKPSGSSYGLEGFDFITNFDLYLNGIHFTESVVKSQNFIFDQAGKLDYISFGSNCYPSLNPQEIWVVGCTVKSRTPSDFYMRYYVRSDAIVSRVGGINGSSAGAITIREIDPSEFPAEIPEPASPLLFLFGLGVVASLKRWVSSRPLRLSAN